MSAWSSAFSSLSFSSSVSVWVLMKRAMLRAVFSCLVTVLCGVVSVWRQCASPGDVTLGDATLKKSPALCRQGLREFTVACHPVNEVMMMKRNKMLTMWVTEDEHVRLLERCNGKQLAAWMRQTCLDEKPSRAGKLPSISPALLRQLAGMGNNLNQIARKVNAGGGNGHDRVQVIAALMAIDAGLERLRHAVLEKGTDDDS